MQDLKQKVLEILKTKGYPEYQLEELNPIIQATIDVTKQVFNIANVSNHTSPKWDCDNCKYYPCARYNSINKKNKVKYNQCGDHSERGVS